MNSTQLHHHQPVSLQTGPPAPSATAPRQDAFVGHKGKKSSGSESPPRGRRMSRDDDDADGQGTGDGDQPPRKRRRSRKAGDKKFECPEPGCGKTYSRAEHLYRHQLNHQPKQIYACDFPECDRQFVRQDLCARHRERHTAKGSQLQRKDVFMHNINTPGKPTSKTAKDEAPSSVTPTGEGFGKKDGTFTSPTVSTRPSLQHQASTGSTSTKAETRQPANAAATNTSYKRDRSSTEGAFSGYEPTMGHTATAPPRQSTYPPPPEMNQQRYPQHIQTSHPPSGMHNLSLSSPYHQPPQYGNHMPPTHNGHDHVGYMHHNEFIPLSLPPPGYQTMAQTMSGMRDGTLQTARPPQRTSMDQMNSVVTSAGHDSIEAQLTEQYAMPVFGGEGYARSPFAMAEDFAAWLFNETQMGNFSPMARQPATVGFNDTALQYQSGVFLPGEQSANFFPNMIPQQNAMAVSNILHANMPESQLSTDKRQSLLDLMEERFNETIHGNHLKPREHFWEGNKDDDSHILSLRMMQTYIQSYWVHFHPQMPILHKPTFAAGKTPDLLLILIIALGASCLDKIHGHATTTLAAELSNFLAWHVRWEMFRDADFRPPAKLWIFQALLLLETYEKMFSTRALHERAHIHHATNITLMRRGSSLTGRAALDSPPSARDDKGPSSASSGSVTPDEWWTQWVAAESTRRTAFAAFVLDSTHATMFGHSAVMVAHEMRLPLPCDEALWSATSSGEVYRIEQSLLNNGVKPVTFLEGLKKTLMGHTVRTNAFGRIILMAGLLSVSWHMNQRDLQVSSLGVSSALGGKDKWRGSLTRAFDQWREDFDRSLNNANGSLYEQRMYPEVEREGNIFESRFVLHNLAHMAMHVDIVDLQIFVGAPRLLGRSIGPQDYAAAQRRMKDWVPTARARDAVFYALQFLTQVLLPPPSSKQASAPPYSAREDFILNRPWVLHYAALIIFSYSYTLEGAVAPPQPSTYTAATQHQAYQAFLREESATDEDKHSSCAAYLTRMANAVRTPEDLSMVTGKNRCAGVLLVLCELFKRTRWELLHEAAVLLEGAVQSLRGRR